MGAMRALFVSYDGLAEPLGKSQVLPYVAGLVARGATGAILSFEKPADLENRAAHEALRAEVAATGVLWTPLRYHKRPTLPATLYDVSAGVAVGARLIQAHGLRAVHARSYVSALVGLALKRLLGVRFIFDMRNFWADEKVDAGAWPAGGALYRAAKYAEQRFLRAADHVVVLTERAREELATFPYLRGRVPPISVIPTCVDLDLFHPAPEGPPPGPPRLVYAGSLGGRYLTGALLRFVAAVVRRAPGARLTLLTRTDPAVVHRAREEAGLAPEVVETAAASREAVAAALRASHAGLSFLSEAYSNRSSAPTKLAEYLASGLPLVVTPGVGDTDAIVERERAGVVLRGQSNEQAAEALLALLQDPGLSGRCRAIAERHFALPSALDAYETIWRALA